MKPIKYVVGDATKPNPDYFNPTKLIIHCCNDIGGWGRGFVIAISRRWKQPEEYYRAWSKGDNKVAPPIQPPDIRNMIWVFPPKEQNRFGLGEIQFIPVEYDTMIVNMVGQHDTKWNNGIPPVRYESIRSCLQKVANWGLANKASVHCPRFGSVLAGGEWNLIEKIIQEELSEKDIEVTVYDLPKNS